MAHQGKDTRSDR